MKSTFYLVIFFAAFIMMVSAAPNPKQTCQVVKDKQANAVCKKYCGKTGYLLGECGSKGVCICKKPTIKKTTKKVVSKKSAKKHSTKKHSTKKQ
ncbi:hypothetical protein BD770DRAFT_394998 [Pilaira anomala]|nr:hypothetical protein BD770DRAFT_394998 [Pilaira anomala]